MPFQTYTTALSLVMKTDEHGDAWQDKNTRELGVITVCADAISKSKYTLDGKTWRMLLIIAHLSFICDECVTIAMEKRDARP